MPNTISSEHLKIHILCPTGKDGQLIASVLRENQLDADVASDITELSNRCVEGCGAIVIADEVLNQASVEELSRSMARQEPWSDIPIIVMTTKEGKFSRAHTMMIHAFTSSGNVTLLERPLRPMTLLSVVQVALRARRRQYQVRDLIVSQSKATSMRDEFISIASHELKTPLTSLKLQAQINQKVLERDPDAVDVPRVTRFVDQTLKQLERLHRLVDDMLDVTRISSGKLGLQPEKINLSELVNEIVDRFTPQFAANNCELTLNIEEGVTGTWDPFKIEQVINNLFTNALKYAPGAPVSIVLKKDDQYATLLVRDSGPGIPQENTMKVFERFERLEPLSSVKGLGLGLFISQQIMDLHQGTITVESKVGEGSTFIIRLPV